MHEIISSKSYIRLSDTVIHNNNIEFNSNFLVPKKGNLVMVVPRVGQLSPPEFCLRLYYFLISIIVTKRNFSPFAVQYTTLKNRTLAALQASESVVTSAPTDY